MLQCDVDVGRVKYVTKPTPTATLASLNSEGFDSTWAPAGPGTAVGRDEFCVYEPWRVLRITGTILSDKPMDNLRMVANGQQNPFQIPFSIACRICRGVINSTTGVCESCGRRLTI